MPRRRFQRNVYATLRRRIIRETEVALALGLKFPDRNPRIPVVEVGKGVFHPTFAARYWRDVLGMDEDEFTSRYSILAPQSDRYIIRSPSSERRLNF